MDYELLHRKFQKRKEYLVFDKETIVHRLKTRYEAIEIEKESILDLVNDDQLEYDYIFCCLKVDDPKIINKIFTKKELADFQWEIDDNLKRGRKFKYKTKTEAEYNQLIIDEMEGRRIDIILESLDGQYVTGFLVRNQSVEISSYIFAHMGGAHFTQPHIKKLTQEVRDITDEEFKEAYVRFLSSLDKWNLM